MSARFKSYLIIDNNYYTNMDKRAQARFQSNFKSAILGARAEGVNIDFACFRYANEGLLNAREYEVLTSFARLCQEHDIKPVINLAAHKLRIARWLSELDFNISLHFKDKDMDILEQLNLKKQGPSAMAQTNLDMIKARLEHTFYSAHSIESANKALNLGIDYITISPIYYDKGNPALGLDFLHNMPINIKKRSFALGGINNKQRIYEVKNTGVLGFASISYFSKHCL